MNRPAQSALQVLRDHYEKLARGGQPVTAPELQAFIVAAQTVSRNQESLAILGGHVLTLTMKEYQRQLNAALAAAQQKG
jgi:hypothetical protein